MRAALMMLAAVIAPIVVSGQDPAKNPRLKVAFVGNLETERGRDFLAFLGSQFGTPIAVERKACDPRQLRAADVVLLDWSQSEDGILSWVRDRSAPRVCPLGTREEWDRPTVLIGSAGLNVATAWGLKGSFG